MDLLESFSRLQHRLLCHSMGDMKIRLVRSAELRESFLDEVGRILKGSGSAIEIRAINAAVELEDTTLPWSVLFGTLRDLRKESEVPDDTFLVLLTTRPNAENWFSGFQSLDERNVFIHAGDWEYYVPCEPAHAVAYEVIANCMQCLMFDSLAVAAEGAHEPPVGCMNDMCAWKPDITLKLRTADICPDCLARCEEQGVAPEVIDQALGVMEIVRSKALYTADCRRKKPRQESLPFPVAFTKRKLQMTTDPMRKFLLLIDHFDSLVRTATLVAGRILLGNEFPAFADEQELSARPSLGHWVAALQALSRLPAMREKLNLALPGDFAQRIEVVVQRAAEGRIVQLRNEHRGHGYCDCHDQAYRETFEVCMPAISFIEETLAPFFASLTLVYVETADRITHDETEIRLRSLMGDHPDFLEGRVVRSVAEMADIPISLHVYAVPANGGPWHDLNDSIVHDHCPICQHSRVLVSDGEQYLDPYAGHRVKLSA
jgi:hypothetical protein